MIVRRQFCVATVALVFLVGRVRPIEAQATDIDLGAVILSISDSRTAQVFHIVDQLSQWDRYTHKAYVRWASTRLALTAEDGLLLERHAELRRARGWGNGFEQAFLVEEPIESAAQRAIDLGILSAEESAAEQAILLHFAPKIEPLRLEQAPRMAEFRRRLAEDRVRLTDLAGQIARFAGVARTVRIPVFLVPNPETASGGGGANGGRLVVEVPSADPMGFLLHETLHVLLAPHGEAIRAAADSAGTPWSTLNEAIAYAFAPGITSEDEESDYLAEQIARFMRRGTPPSDPYVQSYTMAIVIRPLLRACLEQRESLAIFLPRAVDRWRGVAAR